MHRRTFLATALAAGVLTGCGFHLRGEMKMPFKRAFLNGDENHRLIAGLRRQLRLNSVDIVDTRQQADVLIVIRALTQDREILSLDSGGKAREYRLFYTLDYSLERPSGETLRPPSKIRARREYTFDTNQLLAKAQEEDILFRDMEDDLLQQLMRRLATVSLEAPEASPEAK